MKTLFLIDAHALIHRLYHAVAPLTTESGESVGAIYGLSGMLIKIMTETVEPDYVAACFDRPEPTFRKEMYAEYKATRKPADDDLISQFARAREVFEKMKVKIFEIPGFEADDLLATLATRFKGEKDLQVVIFSGDRDLLQLVEDDKVVVDIIKNGASVTERYNEEKVIEKYELKPAQIIDLKGLAGDPSDNIPGVPGVGPKTATPLLKEFGTVEEIYDNLVIIPEKVAKKFAEYKDQALLSKRLAKLDTQAPVIIDSLEDLKTKSIKSKELIDFFNELGFISLVKRVEEG